MEKTEQHWQQQRQDNCFLCTLDPRHICYIPSISGHLLIAQEHILHGEATMLLLIDTDTEQVEVALEAHYYRKLLKELQARCGNVIKPYNLSIKILHLPTEPEILNHQGRTRQRYFANAYTLAILEPDVLLNITDLNQAEYCSRQYMLKRMLPSPSSRATIRGNLVHYCFKELLKTYGHISPAEPQQEPAMGTSLAVMEHHLEQALEQNHMEIALADVSLTTLRDEVRPHLESLSRWFDAERNTLWNLPEVLNNHTAIAASTIDEQNKVRAETFLLAPEIGLRGRLDLFWQQNEQRRLLELKTGGASGELPKRDHRWQVHGYHALLAVRNQSQMKRSLATLVYSGTPGQAQSFGIPSTIREMQRVNETRNILILSRLTGIPSQPPGPSRCQKCALLEQCTQISTLLNWQPPALDAPEIRPYKRPDLFTFAETFEDATRQAQPRPKNLPAISSEDKEFFAKYYYLLQKEEREIEKQQALLWSTLPAQRLTQGSAIQGLKMIGSPIPEHDGWLMTFTCENLSELRAGDEILLSKGDPIKDEVVTGTIMQINAESVTTWTRETIDQPQLIDRYDNDLVHIRTLQNLPRWHQVPTHLRDLVAGRVRPRFREEPTTRRIDFNAEQNEAVIRALEMQDYLLIHGPPGTGKTSVIAEIVKHLIGRGERVLLAAFTNQAVDNMLKRLDREGISDYLRLGSERSVDETIRPHLLKELIVQQEGTQHPQARATSNEIVQDILYKIPIIASTTATWSSDKYVPQMHHPDGSPVENTDFMFDVAIIDEAGQLTVPAILGALRFAKRFILVGDEKQLPPLVLSEEAIAQGLGESLFSRLKTLDEDYAQKHQPSISACVPLRVQYRMNKWISNFASRVFYNQQLQPHHSIANIKLEYQHQPGPQLVQQEEQMGIAKVLNPLYPLAFFNVRQENDMDNTKHSDVEARAVRNIVASLLIRGIAQKDIGVIAPYRAQVANIRRSLFSDDNASGWLALPIDTELSIDTVDRFQGGERKVIIISFATTKMPTEQHTLRKFLTNEHRLNVALTRAQRKMILIGNVAALEELPIFSRLITYCRSMHTLISEKEYATISAISSWTAADQ